MRITITSKGPNYAPPICGSLRSFYRKLAPLRLAPVVGVMFKGASVLTLQIYRDSVHPGDDCDPHLTSITVDESITIEKLLAVATAKCTLPKIYGGNATWFAYIDTEPKYYLGVIAQQWKSPKLLTKPSETVGTIFTRANATKVIFRYWCQSDPNEVYLALSSNSELPSRYQ